MADETLAVDRSLVLAVAAELRPVVEQTVTKALAEPPPPPPSEASYPPQVLTGQHASMFREAIRDVVRHELENIVAESVRRSVDERTRDISSKIEKFLTEDRIVDLIVKQATKIAEESTIKILKRLGLQADEDHIEGTGQALRGILLFHGRASQIWGGAIYTVMAAIFVALLAMVGVHLPSNPLGGGGGK